MDYSFFKPRTDLRTNWKDGHTNEIILYIPTSPEPRQVIEYHNNKSNTIQSNLIYFSNNKYTKDNIFVINMRSKDLIKIYLPDITRSIKANGRILGLYLSLQNPCKAQEPEGFGTRQSIAGLR